MEEEETDLAVFISICKKLSNLGIPSVKESVAGSDSYRNEPAPKFRNDL